ncbi:MAG: hypothetical protein BWY99_01370 [Synergistetes bacterium ADurb.BinA166]|nr:MAG: hypothetical protein BWY99_01370 [Synergistetes bacterium ADurb.BinA166]
MASPKTTPRSPAALPKKTPRVIQFSSYVPDPETKDVVERAVQFLDWAAREVPKRFIPYPWIAKVSISMNRVPNVESPEVQLIRKKIGSIKKVLWDRYNRRAVSAPRTEELGLRATVDDDDMAATDWLRNKRRVHNGIRRLEDTRNKMDVESMRDAGLRESVLGMDPVMKKLTQGNLMDRLKQLPARASDDED